MNVTEVLIPTTDGKGELRGVLAIPDGPGPFPAAIMVHEVFGIEENMRAQIERLCSAGYVVLMPDLFSRGGARRCLMATFRALTDGRGQAFDDVAAARRLLLDRPDCTGKIGVIGFCMGGGFALQLANHGFDAASVNYGMMPKDIEASLVGACPIIGSYGAKDGSLKGAAGAMERALTNAHIPHDIKEYKNANHAFMNPGPAGPKVLRPVMSKVVGMKPYPTEAADAWRRIEEFFAMHLAAE
ncbi:dienelactone hydrolase family protein [Alpinimonas psychrophila]|uniref:Carboxymethylenebutenolidase n=1 Tax=Alpinimonas psychrophila TaxID=748908 RepID=A0A7W3JV73_9MICO|nr:dienelactone hydrolase family protein [Alpinimonas psychrophila]MBA8829767.1 carboxymethylenebutenolidase [Alpinimonas psychrophila]